MKFKEMKIANKILFITNIILAILAVILFIGGLIFRGNSDEIAKLLFQEIEIAKTLIATGIGRNDVATIIEYLFGYICGIAVIDGILAYFGIRAAKTNKVKAALVLFIIADIVSVIIGTLSLSLEIMLFAICIICLIIMSSNNKKAEAIDVTSENVVSE